jgi:hypothetical protein
MSEVDEEVALARARLDDVVDHLRIVAADADTQNAWLHPCGWTRGEPYVHVPRAERTGCMPVDELYVGLTDMWPLWRTVLLPVLTPAIEEALNELFALFEHFNEAAWVDELETLDRPEWAATRRAAEQTIAIIQRELPTKNGENAPDLPMGPT